MRPALSTPTAAIVALERAREAYRAADWPATLRESTRAAIEARSRGDRIAEGRAWAIRGRAEYGLGRDPTASFARAFELMADEGGIYLACAEVDYGWYRLECGEDVEALGLFESARARAFDLGDLGRSLQFDNARVVALYADGSYLKAAELAASAASFAVGVEGNDAVGARADALRLRACALLALSLDDARAAVDAYAQAATATADVWDTIVPHLLAARCARDLTAFPAQIARATAVKGTDLATIGRLWQWATLYEVDTPEACRRLTELYTPAARPTSLLVRMERRAVDYATRRAPAVDLTGSLDVTTAREQIDAALVLAAHRRTDGKLEPMRRLLGRDKMWASRKREALGLPRRPRGRPKSA